MGVTANVTQSHMACWLVCNHGEFNHTRGRAHAHKPQNFSNAAIGSCNAPREYQEILLPLSYVIKSRVVWLYAIFEVNPWYSGNQVEFFYRIPTQASRYSDHPTTQVSKRDLLFAWSGSQMVQGTLPVQGPLNHCTSMTVKAILESSCSPLL